MKCLTTLSVVGMLTSCVLVNAQTFTVRSGKWSSPSTWSGGAIPDASSGSITINHKIIVPADTSLSVDEVILQDTLIVEAGALLTVNNGTLTDVQVLKGGLKVFGKIICTDGATFSGMTATNSFFRSPSTYEHRYFSTAGEPPFATWDKNSTLEITGYINSHSLNTSGWSQSFGNVIYNCPNQMASGFIEMLGNLKEIKGNFNVKNTNGGVLRLTLDRALLNTINIGGDFIIEGKSEVWFSRAANTVINVGGNFEYKSTATASSYLTTTGSCEVNVKGNFIMNSIGILRFASATANGNGTLRVKGNVFFEKGQLAVLPTGRGILECNGNLLQNFRAFGTSSSELTTVINNTRGVSVVSNSILGGDLTVKSGAWLILPTGNAELQGDFVIESGGSLTNNKGTLLLSGIANQTISLLGDTLHNLKINKAAGASVALSSTLNISGALLIQSTNTNVISNGYLTLLSNSDDGTGDASVATLPTASSIIGDVTVQRYMSGEGRLYRYLSSPVRSASVADWKDNFPITGTFTDPSTGPGIRPTSPSLYFYDEKIPMWIAYPATGLAESNKLVVGRGYSAYIREPLLSTTWDVTDTLNQGEVDFHVTYTNTDDLYEGWNLVGNPYPSSIDWNSSGWEKINVENKIAVRDNGQGKFLYWDGAIGSLGSGRIAMGQAFWIQTNGENPSLKIRESAKTQIPTSFYREQIAEIDFIEVIVDRGDASDKAYLRLRSDATAGYDAMDIAKWDNDFLNLSFESENHPLAISSIDTIDCTHVPLSLQFTKKANGSFIKSPLGNYSLSLNSNGVFSNSNIEVFDAYTKQTFNFLSGSYPFLITTDSASFREDRFSLILSSPPIGQASIAQVDSVLCGSSSYQVLINELQDQVRYSLFINDKEVDSYLNRGELSLILKADTLNFPEGVNTYSVIALNACERVNVNQSNFHYSKELQRPTIREEDGLLISNYDDWNKWYLNDEEIPGEFSSTIRPEASGSYSVKVTLDQCEAIASYDFVFQDGGVLIYPNPVEHVVTFVAPKEERIRQAKFIDCLGKLVKEFLVANDPKESNFDISELPAGIYLAEIVTNKGMYVRKVLKS